MSRLNLVGNSKVGFIVLALLLMDMQNATESMSIKNFESVHYILHDRKRLSKDKKKGVNNSIIDSNKRVTAEKFNQS